MPKKTLSKLPRMLILKHGKQNKKRKRQTKKLPMLKLKTKKLIIKKLIMNLLNKEWQKDGRMPLGKAFHQMQMKRRRLKKLKMIWNQLKIKNPKRQQKKRKRKQRRKQKLNQPLFNMMNSIQYYQIHYTMLEYQTSSQLLDQTSPIKLVHQFIMPQWKVENQIPSKEEISSEERIITKYHLVNQLG